MKWVYKNPREKWHARCMDGHRAWAELVGWVSRVCKVVCEPLIGAGLARTGVCMCMKVEIWKVGVGGT